MTLPTAGSADPTDESRLEYLTHRVYRSIHAAIGALMSGERPDALPLRAQLAALEDEYQSLSADVDASGRHGLAAAGRLTAEYFAALRPVIDAMEAGQVRQVRDLGLEFARQFLGPASGIPQPAPDPQPGP